MSNQSHLKKPAILEYDDYREFLAATYRYLKERDAAFSFRYFSKKAGFASPNFLKLVMQGKRNLSQEGIKKFIKGFNFLKIEGEFFELLVQFNQAKRSEQKNFFYQKIRRMRKYRGVRKIDPEQLSYYSKWQNICIRELSHSRFFKADPKWIASQLIPNCSEKEAATSLVLLEKLGMLKREDNQLKPADLSLRTSPEVQALSVMNFHKEMLNKAKDSLDLVPATERDMSSVTISISEKDMEQMKAKIMRFRRDLMAEFDKTDGSGERVYQLGIQLFPLTHAIKDSD